MRMVDEWVAPDGDVHCVGGYVHTDVPYHEWVSAAEGFLRTLSDVGEGLVE